MILIKVSILFLDHFLHSTSQTQIDEIRFSMPVKISQIRILRSGCIPHPTLPNLQGFKSSTQISPITGLEIYFRDISKFGSNLDLIGKFENLNEKPSSNDTCIYSEELLFTDHLLFKGIYCNLSICVYGERIVQNLFILV